MKKLTVILLAVTLLCSFTAARAFTAASFSGPNDVFSKERALYILDNFIGYTENDMQRAADRLGLGHALAWGYNKPVSDRGHTCAFSLLTGTVSVDGEERNAAIIAVRGTGAGEWYSNYDIAPDSKGECAFAENFMRAAQGVFDMVAPLIDELDDPFIVATGYSRGAACANLLGMLLDDRYGIENVTVYTFATPNTAHGDCKGYTNIFNICNEKDSVTHWPPAEWGFSRVGQDILVSDPKVDFSAMEDIFRMLLELAPDVDAYYGLRHSLIFPGPSDAGLSLFELAMLFCDLMYQDSRAEALSRLTIAAAGNNDFDELIPKFLEASAGNGGKAGMLTEHGYETYRSLIRKLD